MRIELINTGSELMVGQTLNTHLGGMSERLAGLGLELTRQHTVPDGEVIGEVLSEVIGRADVVLVTGGLGPTKDDRTREAVAQCLGRELRMDAEVERTVLEFFERRGLKAPDRVRVQGMVPEGAVVLPNPNGTAPGLLLESGERWIFCLPGPPGELWPMVEREVLPRLRQRGAGLSGWQLETWKVVGLGESQVEERIAPVLRKRWPGLEIGLCARAGEGDLKPFSGTDPNSHNSYARQKTARNGHLRARRFPIHHRERHTVKTLLDSGLSR